MAINTATFGNIAYSFPNFAGAAPTTVNGHHRLHDTAAARIQVTLTQVAGSIANTAAFATNAAGDTLYLPYDQDAITSVVVPTNPPAGVTGFITANMSGCRLYIDRDTATGDLILYHANHMVPGGGVNPLLASTETAAQAGSLDGMHTTAMTHYVPRVLATGATIGSPVYRRRITHAVARKQAQRRTNVQYTGGTSIAGTFAGGAWSFHWQTWAYFEYDRPAVRSKISKHKAGTFSDITILEHGQIYP